MRVLAYILMLTVMFTFGCGYAWEQYGDDNDDSNGDDNQTPQGEKIQNFTWTAWDGQELNLYD